jgi:hypothetical protein
LGRRSDVRAAAKVGVERARQSRTLEALREGYAKNGQALWDYARAVIKELPEAERQAETTIGHKRCAPPTLHGSCQLEPATLLQKIYLNWGALSLRDF